MTSDAISSIRKQLLALGYHPLPNRYKVPVAKGWNTPEFISREMNDARIESWAERYDAPTIGVRVENGLCIIDIDVNHPLAGDLLIEIYDLVPDLYDAPTRFGKSEHKMALFCRTEDSFVRVASRRYDGHCVEIFGGAPLKNGNCSRQFGVFGAYDETCEYEWLGENPDLSKITLADLPVLSKAQALEICTVFEQLAYTADWIAEARPVTDGASAVYDIDDATRFDTDRAGRGIDYTELSAAVEAHGELRCSSSFIAGRSGRDPQRCWVFWSKKHDCAAVYVYGDEATHYPKQFAPVVDPVVVKLKARQAEKPAKSAKPGDGAGLDVKALWLLESYGYCALNDSVVMLDEAGDDCQLRPLAFQRLYRSWREALPKKNESSAPKFGYATSYWEVDPGRLNIAGVRMRPDQPFPVYEENGNLFKNTYSRPQHAGQGDISLWERFMQHLIPDAIERVWFCDWLAHKHVNPGIPGVAVIMVAANDDGPVYGAGRGILRDILARLFGQKYVKPLDFDVFTGQSAQGTYTDWAAYSTLITVNEAKDTTDSGKWSQRRAVYERLKEIVDPRAIERTFTVKGRPAFTARSFASYLVFSNNRDAVQIAQDDRRITALANGGRMTAEMAIELTDWMEQDGNIAELARWLEARDLGTFDAYQPLVTHTKTTMQELAATEIDEAFAAARRLVGKSGLFTSRQLELFMLNELQDTSDMSKRQVKRMVKQAAKRVKEFRFSPKEGRDWILCWRDHNPVYIEDETRARNSAHSTGKRLQEAVGTGSCGQVILFPKEDS